MTADTWSRAVPRTASGRARLPPAVRDRDPSAYLAELPQLCDELPLGAQEFASDPAHYDMHSARCVKDLKLTGVRVATDKSGGLVLEFAPNEWKHESGLRLTYSGVRHFSIAYGHTIDWMQADSVLLDETLPDEDGGCRYEIALTDATVVVRCRDLEAVWEEAPRPDRDGG